MRILSVTEQMIIAGLNELRKSGRLQTVPSSSSAGYISIKSDDRQLVMNIFNAMLWVSN